MFLRLPLSAALCFVLLPVSLRAIPANLAPAGTATASTSDSGSVAGDINDNNRDGVFNSGSVWHSVIPDTAPWVEVDLGADYFLDRVMIWPRTDVVQGTVKNIRIRITDTAGAEVFNQVYLAGVAADNPWGTTSMRGTKGRRVRVSRADSPVNPNYFNLAELVICG